MSSTVVYVLNLVLTVGTVFQCYTKIGEIHDKVVEIADDFIQLF